MPIRARQPKRSGPGRPPIRLENSERTPTSILRDIQEGRVDPTTLDTQQRRACLAVLANGTRTSHDLGALFGVASSTIRMDLRKIRQEVGQEVTAWSTQEVIAHMTMCAERYSAQAIRDGDVALAWAIQRDLVKTFREWGIGGADHGGGIRITIEDLSRRYRESREKLTRTLDPTLTGEVVDAEWTPGGETSGTGSPPGLPVPTGHPDQDQAPQEGPAPGDPSQVHDAERNGP